DDESLRRWKEKLVGSVEGDFNGQMDPEVRFSSLGISKDVEEITISLPLKEALSGRPLFTLREGAHYRFKLAFTVLHNIVSGLTCTNTVWNGGIQEAYQHFLLGYFNIDSDVVPYILCHRKLERVYRLFFSKDVTVVGASVESKWGYIDAYVPAMKMFREILKEHTLKRSHQETSFLVNVEICHCLLGVGFMTYIFDVKAGEPPSASHKFSPPETRSPPGIAAGNEVAVRNYCHHI
ncbi:Rho GDP-dissociation inhibitor 1-like protein, partial [Tanacetum coccineum]